MKMLRQVDLTLRAQGHIGLPLEIPQPTTDVTQWDTFRAPDDDIHGIILAALKAAPTGTIVTSSQYGFTDQDIADEFARLGIANPSCRFLFDKTQEGGTHEKPIVQGLVAKLQPDQWAIGTSSKAHQILHTKAIALTYPDNPRDNVVPLMPGWTVTGSFNLSTSAESQFNVVDVIISPSRTALFRSMIEAMFTWVKTNETNNQP
jgi:hypothetical protein